MKQGDQEVVFDEVVGEAGGRRCRDSDLLGRGLVLLVEEGEAVDLALECLDV